MRIVVYGTSTPQYNSIVSTLKGRLNGTYIDYEIIEENNIEVFLEKAIESVPAIQLEDGPIIALGHNGQVNYSLQKFIKKMIPNNKSNNMRLIVPVDFSKTSANALDYALNLGAKIGASVQALHVYIPSSQDLNEFGVLGDDMMDLHEQQLSAFVKKSLEDKNYKVEVEEVFKIGFPAKEILKMEENEEKDIIIMGTNGMTNDIWYKLGSVSLEAMQRASCPVIVVPEDAKFEAIDNILFAFEDTVQDVTSLQKLFKFAKLFDSDIHLVHVEKEGVYKDAERLLEFSSAHYPKNKMTLKVIQDADIVEGLNEYAANNAMDWIVMPTHKRSFFGRLFHSSVSSKMAAHAKIPIIILK